jgi:hypothetical protein
MQSSSPRGACMRSALLEDEDIRVLRADLVARFSEASKEEVSQCNEFLVESLAQLKAFQVFTL